MSGGGPSLPSRRLWARREEYIHAQVRFALQHLHSSRPHLDAECDLNRKFYFALLEAGRKLDPKGKQPPPTMEACNQPDPDDLARVRREAKRPDFQWLYLDPHEPDPRRAARQFVAECKRLGFSGDRNWVLNENYVMYGVARFVHPDWAYAKGAPSALMVGYWQGLPLAQVLAEVNAGMTGLKATLPILERRPTAALLPGVEELKHVFKRAFAPSPFSLAHFWVDVR